MFSITLLPKSLEGFWYYYQSGCIKNEAPLTCVHILGATLGQFG